jgi:hypothetical protein
LGYAPPKATAVREFLEHFHDKELEKLRPEREVQKSFIFPSSVPVAGLVEASGSEAGTGRADWICRQCRAERPLGRSPAED